LLGFYRRGEAHDPRAFVSGIAAAFTCYPKAIVRTAVDPRIGIPRRLQWEPSVAEVHAFCEGEMRHLAAELARHQRTESLRRQIERRKDDPDKSERPTLKQLKAKYGPTWGIHGSAVRAVQESAEQALERLAGQPLPPLSDAAKALFHGTTE
jgi:hypothetical protein